MPANLTPDYRRADQRYREAQTPNDRLAALEEMLAVIPKHKGTDKMCAELRRKISEAKKEVVQASKKGGAHRDIFHVPRQGAGQVVLLGLPNVGKSALVTELSNAECKVADYPFTTQVPQPGMAHHEDVPIQLVDMPPFTREHVPPGFMGRVNMADAILIVVNLASPDLLEELEACLSLLSSRGLVPTNEAMPMLAEDPEAPDPKRTLVACAHGDAAGAVDEFDTLKELYGDRLELHRVSSITGEGLDELLKRLFELLYVVRIYAKPPGKPVDKTSPFIVPKDSTVQDLAITIHRALGEHLKAARVWGEAVYAGQNVPHDYVLHDKDVVELHM
jgi:uncharacterized protein